MYSFETGVGGAASEATMEVIPDSGASHNVVPKEWVKHLEWGPAEGPAGFRTADGSWLPNLGTAVVSLKSAEGFSFKVRFSVASVEACLAQRHSSAEARAHDPLERVEGNHLREGRSRQSSDL